MPDAASSHTSIKKAADGRQSCRVTMFRPFCGAARRRRSTTMSRRSNVIDLCSEDQVAIGADFTQDCDNGDAFPAGSGRRQASSADAQMTKEQP
jgi:hypothetical protein